MSLEQKVVELTTSINDLIAELKEGSGPAPAKKPAAKTEASTPDKKVESKPAPEAKTKPKAAAKTEEAEGPTLQDVRVLLLEVQKVSERKDVHSILKTSGGTSKLPELKETKYQDVIDACTKHLEQVSEDA